MVRPKVREGLKDPDMGPLFSIHGIISENKLQVDFILFLSRPLHERLKYASNRMFVIFNERSNMFEHTRTLLVEKLY